MHIKLEDIGDVEIATFWKYVTIIMQCRTCRTILIEPQNLHTLLTIQYTVHQSECVS